MIIDVIFIIFLPLIVVFTAVFSIATNNPVHAILGLILLFSQMSMFLFAAGLYYLALVFLVVYVGAIAILFLFVVMLLGFEFQSIKVYHFYGHIPPAAIVLIPLIFHFFRIHNYTPQQIKNFLLVLKPSSDIFQYGVASIFFNNDLQLMGNLLYTFIISYHLCYVV